VAFAIQVLVKGGFYGSAGVHGDDAAAELVHISADSVAVGAFVHDDARIGSQIGGQQRLGLIEVGDVRPGQQEAQRVTERIAGQVDLDGDCLSCRMQLLTLEIERPPASRTPAPLNF